MRCYITIMVITIMHIFAGGPFSSGLSSNSDPLRVLAVTGNDEIISVRVILGTTRAEPLFLGNFPVIM